MKYNHAFFRRSSWIIFVGFHVLIGQSIGSEKVVFNHFDSVKVDGAFDVTAFIFVWISGVDDGCFDIVETILKIDKGCTVDILKNSLFSLKNDSLGYHWIIVF